MRELVSIILPTYNRAQLLPRAVDSVLSQTYENWELIIWNDGSTDNSDDVIRGFRDTRIRSFSSDNFGMSHALNQAIKKSRGEYIAFLDDDDEWDLTKLELQIKIFSTFPDIDLVFGNYENYFEDQKRPGLGFDQAAKAMGVLSTMSAKPGIHLIENGFLEGIAIDNFVAFDAVMLQRKIIDQIGPFNENLRNGMDLEYWWRLGLAGGKAAYTETVLLKRYKYANSLSSRSIIAIENYIKTLDLCSELSNTNNNEKSINYLLPAYLNAWQNKIIIHGTQGEKKMAWHAFKQSLKYGFSLGSVKLIIKALFFPNSLSSSTQQ